MFAYRILPTASGELHVSYVRNAHHFRSCYIASVSVDQILLLLSIAESHAS